MTIPILWFENVSIWWTLAICKKNPFNLLYFFNFAMWPCSWTEIGFAEITFRILREKRNQCHHQSICYLKFENPRNCQYYLIIWKSHNTETVKVCVCKYYQSSEHKFSFMTNSCGRKQELSEHSWATHGQGKK